MFRSRGRLEGPLPEGVSCVCRCGLRCGKKTHSHDVWKRAMHAENKKKLKKVKGAIGLSNANNK